MDDLYVVSFVVMFNLVELLTVSTNQYRLLKLCNYDSKNLHQNYIHCMETSAHFVFAIFLCNTL